MLVKQHHDGYMEVLLGCIAHELGHPPGRQSENTDHDEDGLMRVGAGPIVGLGNDFTAKTIKRFRDAENWTH